MSTDNNSNQRNPADLGWDDGVLWTDDDVAAFLRIDVAAVTAAVASGIPAIYLPNVDPLDGASIKSRRFSPAAVREHCLRRSLPPPTPTTITTWPRKHPRRFRGSGRLVQS